MANVGVDWKPMLFPNESIKAEEIRYPVRCSKKMDGIRGIFRGGKLLSRSLKPLPNHDLQDGKLGAYLRAISNKYGVTLDGEFYSDEVDFNAISSLIMSHDKVMPEHLKYVCFDCIQGDDVDMPMMKRHELALFIKAQIPAHIHFEVIEKVQINSAADLKAMYLRVLEEGFEGLIVQSENGRYKPGRWTIKEACGFKFKPYNDYDAQVTGIVQATVVDPTEATTTNELGRTVTSKKKGDRIPIPMACSVMVDYKGADGIVRKQKVSLSVSDEEAREIWTNQAKYIGRWIQYKGMEVGAKDVPRHPTSVCWRPDLDGPVKA